ncbi:MAG: choice-of-anchor B family protein [Bacteroidota bacterium]
MKQSLLLVLTCWLLHMAAFAQQGATALNLLGHWQDSTLVGSSFYDNTYNEVWGIARNGHEYAIIGSTAGTHFIDVTDPKAPVEAFFIRGAESGGRIIHRDYHDYGDFLFAVADEGRSTLQIIDLSNLPTSIEVVYDAANLFSQAHNIFIDDVQGRLYTFATTGGTSSFSPLRIYDISQTPTIQLLATHSTFGNVRVSHVHDGYVSNHRAFLNCGNDGFLIVDFSDAEKPVVQDYLSPVAYPQAGYNHSGWLGSDCDYYYMADENWGMAMKVVDVRTAGEVEVIQLFDADATASTSIPHNQVVACDYLYASYYYDGLQVYDLSDPANPQRVAYYDTSKRDHRRSYEGAWGVYPFLPSGNILVSDMQEGLFVLEGMGNDCTASAKDDYCDEKTTAITHWAKEKSLLIYPQPATDHLYIQTEASQPVQSASLYNTQGKIVQTWTATDITTEASGNLLHLNTALANGIYYLLLPDGRIEKVAVMR